MKAEQIAKLEQAIAESDAEGFATVMLPKDDARALLQLARAVNEGPRVAITECNQIPGASDFDFGDMSHACQQFKPGQTVALIAVEKSNA